MKGRTFMHLLQLFLSAALLLSAPAQGAIPAVAIRDGLPTLAPVLSRVTPAVVNIAVLQQSPEAQNPLLRDPFFRRFFGLPEQQQPQISAGSGVIVDAKNGYVLTNHHVVKDAREVLVTLKDNRRLPAKLVGSDAGTDIAVLRIEPGELAEAKFGDSDTLQVGDFVVAIGNPFGIGQTVTSGIVSALGRSGLTQGAYEDFIQTDASINPGNSGGALINLRGELVGINTAIIGPSGGNVGIGFAVPANMARAVMRQIIRFGEVRRGRLGVVMQDLTRDLARSLGISARTGVALTQVIPDSPAAQAGLRMGDVITAINGRQVRGSAELRAQLGVVPVGETVELRVLRGAETRQVRVQIGAVEARGGGGSEPIQLLAGASIANAERQVANGKEAVVYVTKVAPGSAAFKHGLRAGDIILGVNRRRVANVEELIAAMRVEGRIAIHVQRGDFQLTIVVR
ncbi:MAG: DegQ family serine endoprotease [Burkholderiales bacterium]